MHLTYICQFLRMYIPPHLSSPSQIPILTHPYSQPRRTPPNHVNIRLAPGRVLRLLNLLRSKGPPLVSTVFPSLRSHPTKIPS